MSEWISVDNNPPSYGEPVIIVINGIVQNVTYILEGADDCDDWFEPYFFPHDDEIKIFASKVSLWQPLPEPPTKE